MGLDRDLLGLALLLTAACSSAPTRRASDIPALPLSEIDATWFRTVIDSDLFEHYLAIPSGSVHLDRIPGDSLSRMAMTESFLEDASWARILYVAARQPDQFAGIAVLNWLVRYTPNEFVAFWLTPVAEQTAGGLEAALFAHIQDERSRPSVFNPFDWMRGGYHHNAYSACAELLSQRNRAYMAKEWDRLARFVRNAHIRELAERCSEQLGTREGAEPFSRMVDEARSCQQRFLGLDLFATSIHDVLGERKETRQFEIRFFAKHEPPDYFMFAMTRTHVKYVNHKRVLFVRVPVWPHIVSIEGGSSYLDKLQELFDVLEKGEPGEVRMKYARFLVVPGEYTHELADALPPYSYLGMVPEKRLLVARVLDEHAQRAREVLAAHLSRSK